MQHTQRINTEKLAGLRISASWSHVVRGPAIGPRWNKG